VAQAVGTDSHNGAKRDGNPNLPKGFVRVDVGGVVSTSGGHAVVLLVDDKSQRAVPIFIGESEALAIQLRLEKRSIERPLTHDLLDSMVKKLGGSIESVRVERLHDGIFFGIVVLRDNDRRVEIDARSSDAVALAVGNRVPIFMSEAVLERAGVSLKDPDELELVPSKADQRASPVTL
jgi:hypothetical protein